MAPPDPGLLELLPSLLARVTALEAAVAPGNGAAGSPQPPASLLAALSQRCDASDVATAELASSLSALEQEVRSLKKSVGGSAGPLSPTSSSSGAAGVGKAGTGGSPMPAAPPMPNGHGASSGGGGDAEAELRTMAERLRTLTSQQAAMSTLCTGLSAECKRLGHEVEGLRRELSEGSLRREGSDPSLADILRMRDSLTLNHERLYAEYQARLEGLESTVERMGQSGLVPPPETASKEELRVMAADLEGKVGDLQARMEETLRALEERYGPIGDNPFDGVEGGEGGEPGSFDTAAPATPGSTGPSPSPTGRGTATSPQPFPQPPAGTHSPHALSPRASFSGSPVPGGASLVPQPPSAPKGAGAGASSSGGSVTGAGASGGGAGAGGGAGGSGYAWNPDARPMPSRLKNSSSSLSPSAALDAVLAEQGDLSATAQRMAVERKRVQFSAETLARAEAAEVRKRMAEIKSKVQNGGMGSWDMGRVKAQLNKLSQRVQSLERLQRMVDQMNAIGECLEILDRRQKEHKNRIAALEAAQRQQSSAQLDPLKSDLARVANSQHLLEGNVQALRERVVGLEGAALRAGETERRVEEVGFEVERLKQQQGGGPQLRPGTASPAAAPLRPTITSMQVASSVFQRASDPQISSEKRGDVLNLDNPLVREPPGFRAPGSSSSLHHNNSLSQRPSYGSIGSGSFQAKRPSFTGAADGVSAAAAAALAAAGGSVGGSVGGGPGSGTGLEMGKLEAYLMASMSAGGGGSVSSANGGGSALMLGGSQHPPLYASAPQSPAAGGPAALMLARDGGGAAGSAPASGEGAPVSPGMAAVLAARGSFGSRDRDSNGSTRSSAFDTVVGGAALAAVRERRDAVASARVGRAAAPARQ